MTDPVIKARIPLSGMATLLRFYYTNYKGESEWRRVQAKAIFYGSSSYHQGEQWFLEAFDLDRQEKRNFAIRDMTEVGRQ